MSFRRDDRASIFGAFRPDAGQTVSRAVVATYSLDLIAMLGLVLALGGDAETEFESSPLELVQAFNRVRGRLLVLHQTGRVIAPRAHRSVLPLLDTMMQAIPCNERTQSWHPKVALIRYASGDGAQWRFWIGSRNLTGSADLDAGLLLLGSARRPGGQAIPKVALLAEQLLAEASFPEAELDELRSARWIGPPGVTVRDLLWRRPGDTLRFLPAPLLPRAQRASAVSPFIDPKGLGEIVEAGAATTTLLTTDLAAGECAAVEGIVYRTSSPPEPEAAVAVAQQQDEKAGEFIDQPPAGVHAKLLAVTRGARTAMMLGSANFTKRGLVGPNAEAVAILDVREPELAGSLHDFVAAGFEFDGRHADAELAERDRAARQLDEHIGALLECRLRLAYDGEGLALGIGEEADRALARARFEAAPFLEPEGWRPLAPGSRSVRLLDRAPAASEQTSLVTFRATSTSDPGVSRSWVSSLPVDGMDEEGRDRALLARYIGAGRFRDWLRSLMDGVDGTAGQRWSDIDQHAPAAGGAAARFAEMFTLEAMLSAWARDHRAFEARISGMVAMLEAFRGTFEALEDKDERTAALADLEEVRPFLQAVHDAVNGATS